jgi:undecaprenyl-diphosphatase
MNTDRWLQRDGKASLRLRQLAGGRGRWIFAALAHTADTVLLFPAAGLIWLFGRGEWKAGAWKVGLAMLIGTFVTGLLKLGFRRSRPEGHWGAFDRIVDPHSFPSGHANRAATLAVLAAVHGTPGLGVVVALWAAAVSLSRVILGMHYVSDVAAGLAVGAAVAVFF